MQNAIPIASRLRPLRVRTDKTHCDHSESGYPTQLATCERTSMSRRLVPFLDSCSAGNHFDNIIGAGEHTSELTLRYAHLASNSGH